jgi:hypothetical protein
MLPLPEAAFIDFPVSDPLTTGCPTAVPAALRCRCLSAEVVIGRLKSVPSSRKRVPFQHEASKPLKVNTLAINDSTKLCRRAASACSEVAHVPVTHKHGLLSLTASFETTCGVKSYCRGVGPDVAHR